MAEIPGKQVIVVIGSGIIGVASALEIQSSLLERGINSYEVLIVAREFPNVLASAISSNYASMWAGAHVRPIPASTEQLAQEAKWLRDSVSVFKRQIVEEPWLGVTAVPGQEYIGTPIEHYLSTYTEESSFAAETGLDGLQVMSTESLPEGVKFGFSYNTFCINAPIYCMNLLRKFIIQGGKTLQRHLASEWEAFHVAKNVAFVVNASGIGFGDPKSYPTRGQICLVSNPCTKTITQQHEGGEWTYVIPRGFHGGTIIGGTREPDEWSSEPCLDTRDQFLQRLAKVYPEILNEKGRFDVVSDVVCRRPTRIGGMRLEIEKKADNKGVDRAIIHAYGAGGRGYETSWGIAKKSCTASCVDS